MKQINNGFNENYYLTEDGLVYNAETDKTLQPDGAKRYKLKLLDNSFKGIGQR